MPHTTTEFLVLHALRLRGMSTAEPVAQSTGLDPRVVQEILDDTVEQGLTKSRTGGRVEGYMLTADGRTRHMQLRDQEVTTDEQAALAPPYDAFLAPNQEFKKVTTTWQTEADGNVDHVLPALKDVHADVTKVLAQAAGAVGRMATYQPRFDAALAAFAGGNGGALAKPMSGSYHDVWMELHEDFLLTLGRERTEADG